MLLSTEEKFCFGIFASTLLQYNQMLWAGIWIKAILNLLKVIKGKFFAAVPASGTARNKKTTLKMFFWRVK